MKTVYYLEKTDIAKIVRKHFAFSPTDTTKEIRFHIIEEEGYDPKIVCEVIDRSDV